MNKSLAATRLMRRSVTVLMGIATATAAIAQTVTDDVVPDTGLNIPTNLQLFGKRDPNIRKPTAIVNEAVITGTDVDHRVALILSANQNVKLSDEDLNRLRIQILSGLIDETLQIQEAKAADITVKPEEIDRSLTGVAKNFKQTLPQFRTYLRSIGSSERSLRRQIEAELAWSKYLRRKVEPFINVGDTEVSAVIQRMKDSKGTAEYHIREIYLTSSPERDAQVLAEAKSLMKEIQEGPRSFEQIAMERSEATTRAKGGDLGWVTIDRLPDSLAQVATEMRASQLAGPIPVPGGYSILNLVDNRTVGAVDPLDTRLSLRQISLAFPAGISQTDASNKVAEFAKATQGLKGCGDAKQVAAALGAEVVDNDSVKIRDLPPQLREIMLNLKVGESTPPFGTPTDGVRSLVVCGRQEPQVAELPSMDQVRNQMEQRGVNLRAEHKLRDLRRDAVVEYR